MQLAPITGWSPGPVAPPASTRPSGLLRSGFAAWRGVPEHADGAPLTSVQVATLAPFLAGRMQLASEEVRTTLERVRILLGGPAADAGGVATTIGTNVYVSDAKHATQILEWDSRWWLAHELTHTMQWLRGSHEGMDDAARDRSFLNRYVGSYVSHDGSLAKGGLIQAFRAWREARRNGTPTKPIGDLIHDAHPLEREANAVADAFRAATS